MLSSMLDRFGAHAPAFIQERGEERVRHVQRVLENCYLPRRIRERDRVEIEVEVEVEVEVEARSRSRSRSKVERLTYTVTLSNGVITARSRMHVFGAETTDRLILHSRQ